MSGSGDLLRLPVRPRPSTSREMRVAITGTAGILAAKGLCNFNRSTRAGQSGPITEGGLMSVKVARIERETGQLSRPKKG